MPLNVALQNVIVPGDISAIRADFCMKFYTQKYRNKSDWGFTFYVNSVDMVFVDCFGQPA